MVLADVTKLFIELGFPVGVAVYLLVYQSKKMDKVWSALVEVQIGQRLLLSKLEATDEYSIAVSEFHKREENGV